MSHANWQTRKSAVIEAREFVHNNSFGTLSTINQGSHDFGGFPAGQIEYYSETDDASLLMIRVDMSSAFGNIRKGSPASLAIRAGDAPRKVTPMHMAANHRIILYGEFDDYTPSEDEMRNFFARHPDADDWRPGSFGFHKTFWTKFTITGIYYIGGFGGEHYIGSIPVDQYKDVELVEESPTLLNWLLSWIL